MAKELCGERGKILHMWSEDDRDAGGDGFCGILAPTGGEAFSYEYDGRAGVPVAKFPGCVDEEHSWLAGGWWLGAARNREPGFFELSGDVRSTFEVAGNQDQEEVGVAGSKLFKDVRHDLFFTLERAAA
ncbi:MAG: hypothetical protein WCQ16_08785 [Verrucomicrobiae bacterium]